jgi:arylsulfatase A-like enzyme
MRGTRAASSEERPREQVYVTPADTLWVALFVGLLAGACEVAVALHRMLILDRFVWFSRDVAWMAPLAAVTFLLAPGLLLAIIAALWRRVTLAWVVGLLTGFALFSLLLAVPRIAHYAIAMVAAGVGVRLGAMAARAPNTWLRFSRHGSLVLGLSFALIGIIERLWRVWSERAAVADLAAAPPDAPNVLLLILDTVRRSNMSLYGYSRPTTPRLEERAAESAVFNFAMSTAPWTLPSHATIFTGCYPDSTMGDWRRPMGEGHRTLARVLRDHGYVTGGFVDNLLFASYESRLNTGFIHYDDFPITVPVILRHFALGRTVGVSKLVRSRSPYEASRALAQFSLHVPREGANEPPNAARRGDHFLQWERRRKGHPFFAFINYFEAHGLFQPTRREQQLFPGGTRLDYYDAAISRLDAEVGRVLRVLEERGVLDNTIVVVTADHGEHLGDHGMLSHANSLYLSLLRVPLLIRFPRRVPAQRVEEPVTLRDLAATILDLTNLHEASVLPGVSLTRFWKPGADYVGSPIFASLSQGTEVAARNARGSLASLLTSEYHYIRGPGDHEELYAYREDSLEERNVAHASQMQAQLPLLRAQLTERLVDRAALGGCGRGRPNER